LPQEHSFSSFHKRSSEDFDQAGMNIVVDPWSPAGEDLWGSFMLTGEQLVPAASCSMVDLDAAAKLDELTQPGFADA
jgi:hypothetical protein